MFSPQSFNWLYECHVSFRTFLEVKVLIYSPDIHCKAMPKCFTNKITQVLLLQIHVQIAIDAHLK